VQGRCFRGVKLHVSVSVSEVFKDQSPRLRV
jgi:hypothetical protein